MCFFTLVGVSITNNRDDEVVSDHLIIISTHQKIKTNGFIKFVRIHPTRDEPQEAKITSRVGSGNAAEIKALEGSARIHALIESAARSEKIRQEMEQLKVERAERAREKRWLETTRNILPAGEGKTERVRKYYCSNEPTARYCYPLDGSLAELPEKWFEHEKGLYRIFEGKEECDRECRRVMDQRVSHRSPSRSIGASFSGRGIDRSWSFFGSSYQEKIC